MPSFAGTDGTKRRDGEACRGNQQWICRVCPLELSPLEGELYSACVRWNCKSLLVLQGHAEVGGAEATQLLIMEPQRSTARNYELLQMVLSKHANGPSFNEVVK